MKIDPQILGLFEELTGWNYEELKKDIRKNGIKVPIIIGVVEGEDEETLVDGHQRSQIWQELGRDPAEIPKEIKSYASREEMIRDAIAINILRRHLTTGQRAYFATKYLLPIENKRARERMLRGRADPTQKIGEGHTEAVEIVGSQVGLSGETIRQAQKVFKEAPEKVVQEVLRGKKSVTRAFKDIKRKEAQITQDKGKPLPEGIYDILYADPPWQHGYEGSHRGAAEMHYKTLKTQEIMDFPIPEIVADDAILFLWVTNAMLPDGLKVAEAWGFDYKSNFSWIKDKIAMGFWTRGQHELLFICKKGNLRAPADENRFPSVIQAPRRGHSEKPEIVYDMIETMYPNRTYIELFARGIEPREGWTYWGDEIG